MSASEFSHRRALTILGKNWVLHPEYKTNPRHSIHAGIYQPARVDYLLQISESARVSRERNLKAMLRQMEEEKIAAEAAHERYVRFRLISA